jgi:hypothetical protein
MSLPDERDEEDTLARRAGEVHLEWRDYIAVAIAALETTLLPFLIFIVVLIALLYVLTR